MASKIFRPLFDRVLIERVQPLTKTQSGILLPESSSKRINEGKVLAVGTGARTPKGETLPMTLKEGDRVLLPEFGGSAVKNGDKELFLFREDDILAIIKE